MVCAALECAVSLTLSFAVDAASFLLGLATGAVLWILILALIWLAIKL